MFSLDRSKNDTSVMLDLLRAIAAQMVCVGHAISFFVPQWRPTRLPYMQNAGVLLFFLISGFLITYTLIERSKDPAYGFRQFFIERFARIYSGLIPALAFIAIIDGVTIYFTGDPAISRYFTSKTHDSEYFHAGGDIGESLQMYPSMVSFGSAEPPVDARDRMADLVIFVASLFFMAARSGSILFLIPIAIFFGQPPIHFLLGSYQADGVGSGSLTLWLCGSLIYFVARSSVYRIFSCGCIGRMRRRRLYGTDTHRRSVRHQNLPLFAPLFWDLL